MPFARYLGPGVAMVVLALLVGFRLLQRRAAGVGPAERPHALTRETDAGGSPGDAVVAHHGHGG